MVRPSPALAARLRLTTKQVNGGYYKGNRTGSMGAHTQWGSYLIDYRKTRNFNCPVLENERLTPFVSKEIEPLESDPHREGPIMDMSQVRDGRTYVEALENLNPDDYNEWMNWWKAQSEQKPAKADGQRNGRAT